MIILSLFRAKLIIKKSFRFFFNTLFSTSTHNHISFIYLYQQYIFHIYIFNNIFYVVDSYSRSINLILMTRIFDSDKVNFIRNSKFKPIPDSWLIPLLSLFDPISAIWINSVIPIPKKCHILNYSLFGLRLH